MEEVGCPEEGQEEDSRPHRHHPHLEGEGPKGVGHHQGLPHKEGGAIDDVRAPAICDGARGVIRWNDARRGALPNFEIMQHIKKAMEPSRDDVGAPLYFVFSVLGHPPMWLKPGHIVFVSFPFSCLLFNHFPDLMILTLRGTGLAEGPHLHASPNAVAEGFIHEGDESHQG